MYYIYDFAENVPLRLKRTSFNFKKGAIKMLCTQKKCVYKEGLLRREISIKIPPKKYLKKALKNMFAGDGNLLFEDVLLLTAFVCAFALQDVSMLKTMKEHISERIHRDVISIIFMFYLPFMAIGLQRACAAGNHIGRITARLGSRSGAGLSLYFSTVRVRAGPG